MDHVIKTGGMAVKKVPCEVMDVPYTGRAVPIMEDGLVVGAIASSQPMWT